MMPGCITPDPHRLQFHRDARHLGCARGGRSGGQRIRSVASGSALGLWTGHDLASVEAFRFGCTARCQIRAEAPDSLVAAAPSGRAACVGCDDLGRPLRASPGRGPCRTLCARSPIWRWIDCSLAGPFPVVGHSLLGRPTLLSGKLLLLRINADGDLRNEGHAKRSRIRMPAPRRSSLIIGMRTRYNGLPRDIRRPPRADAEQPDTVSAARLAAEAAFVMPPVPSFAPAVPVQFVPVRRRLHQPPDLGPPTTTVAAEQPAVKTPRVFRLGDAQGKGLPAQPREATPEEPARRRSEVTAAKRPGPVLRIAASGQRAPLPPASAAPAAQPSPRAQLEQLRMMLTEMEPTFAQIRFAQAFQIELLGES